MLINDLSNQAGRRQDQGQPVELNARKAETLELISGGSFEDAQLTGARFTFNGQVGKEWKSNSSGIETWSSGHGGVRSKDGGDFIEIDRHADTVDAIWQDISTEPSAQYLLKFDAAERPSKRSKNDGVEVYWNGEHLGTVRPNEAGVWETFQFVVKGTGDVDRLEFREVASENNSLGPVLDNVSLKKRIVQEDRGPELADFGTGLTDLSLISDIATELATLSKALAREQVAAEEQMAPAKTAKSVAGKGA